MLKITLRYIAVNVPLLFNVFFDSPASDVPSSSSCCWIPHRNSQLLTNILQQTLECAPQMNAGSFDLASAEKPKSTIKRFFVGQEQRLFVIADPNRKQFVMAPACRREHSLRDLVPCPIEGKQQHLKICKPILR